VKSISILVSLVFAAAWGITAQRHGFRGTAPESAYNPPLAKTESEKKILATLDGATRASELYQNASPPLGSYR
jgi:hypothetical protein